MPLLVALARVFNSGVVLRCCTTGGGEHEQHRGLEDDDEMANDKHSLAVHYLSSFFPQFSDLLEAATSEVDVRVSSGLPEDVAEYVRDGVCGGGGGEEKQDLIT